jgi:7-carboxy-7-deazaguanine synthase
MKGDCMTDQEAATLRGEDEPPKDKVKRHPVMELFGPVIQGEGTQAGSQTLFIRFGGCDYRCTMCDSMHAVLPQMVKQGATYMTPQEIVLECILKKKATGVQWITFSGGNPLMHQLDELVDLLIEAGFLINVETQGTLWQDWLWKCTTITVSPKSMGMGEKYEEGKFAGFVQKCNGVVPVCVKVVVFAEQDLEFALHIYQTAQIAKKNWLYDSPIAYYLSLGNPYPPVVMQDENTGAMSITENPGLVGFDGRREYEKDQVKELLCSYRRLSEELLQDPRLKMYRFLPQLHVLVYGNEAGR